MHMILKNVDKKKIFNLKNLIVFTGALLVISLIVGIIFYILIDANDKLIATNSILQYFQVTNNTSIFIKLKDSLITNISYTVFIWFLGISVIGIIIILFSLFMKGFTTGFTGAAIIDQYKLFGLLANLAYLFPNRLCSIFLTFFMSYYGLLFAINLITYLFFNKDNNLKMLFNNYLKKLILGLIMAIVLSLLEVFISPLIFKLFTILSK